MTSRLSRIFLSKLMFWIVVLIVGFYFIFKIDTTQIQKLEAERGTKLSFVDRILNSIHMPRLKLGIDLQGGTYLILGVEIDKAIENKLKTESKELEAIFKSQKLKVLPSKKEVKDSDIIMSFEDEEAAKICKNLIEKEVPTLKTKLSGLQVFSTLTPAEKQRIKIGSVEQAVSVLSNRLSGFGVEGIIVQQHGEKQIVVQLPGVNDPERVKSVITKTAHLEFKIVEKAAPTKQSLLDDFDGDLPPDKTIVMGKKEAEGEEEGGQAYLVSAFPDLTGDHIVDAQVAYGEYNRVEVSFKLDSSGGKIFRELTGNNIGKPLGIIIDNVMISSPTIQTTIGAQGRITGSRSVDDAKDMALVLRSGALLAPLKFEQETRVGASLGQDSINKGMFSCIIALLLLFLFSILYYKFGGVFATMALIYNIFLILLCLSYFESSLTLPGIAGIVLTIGMAIDASILIYERTKEELAVGNTFRKALNDGFSGALTVILDSNITTFLSGIALFYFGGPAIKGFAVTLMIGVIATVISGVYFLKALYDFFLDNTGIKQIKI
jgi:preprotein translocase subunit SecD